MVRESHSSCERHRPATLGTSVLDFLAWLGACVTGTGLTRADGVGAEGRLSAEYVLPKECKPHRLNVAKCGHTSPRRLLRRWKRMRLGPSLDCEFHNPASICHLDGRKKIHDSQARGRPCRSIRRLGFRIHANCMAILQHLQHS
jgi:hypothetical protein